MKKIITTILTIILSLNSFAQEHDTMFIHKGQTIFHVATSDVDSIIFYSTGESFPLGTDIIQIDTIEITIRDTVRITDTVFTVSGVALDRTTATLTFGASPPLQLIATVSPENATNTAVSWLSSDENIATVSDAGLVTAVSAGVATITVTTEDGGFTAYCVVTVRVPAPISMLHCNQNTPGWGTSLGTVSFHTNREWVIEGHDISQIWSDAVTATACQKTSFDGGFWHHAWPPHNSDFNADCRSNPGFPGDLFSWCAVVRFRYSLCPYPWRVPTVDDFRDLDIAMGGTGALRFPTAQVLINLYIDRWGGEFGGYCCDVNGLVLNRYHPTLGFASNSGQYWSVTDVLYWSGRENNGYRLNFATGAANSVNPENWGTKHGGRSLRCIR